MGATNISMAVTNETKLPTEVPCVLACHSAADTTADNAIAASICVKGVMAAEATVERSAKPRNCKLSLAKRSS